LIDRKPVQLAVAFSATTGLYAASLACVTALQADHDRAVAAIRAPVAADVGALGDANDRLAAEVDRAVAAYDAAADAYSTAADRLQAHESRLTDLGALVTRVSGSAAALPRGVPMPRVGQAATRPSSGRSAPTSHATTGAS
jgi:hypothetical protein